MRQRPCLRDLLLIIIGGVLMAVSASSSRANADEVAPELEGADLRQVAGAELRRLARSMSASEQKRLVGIYAAFDDDASDPIAQVACDDDGDYVIVLSEAMLRLASYLAHGASDDDSAAYARFVAHSQVPGRRLLPPPAGFFGTRLPGTTFESRLREALSFVIARELAHLRAGDLTCDHPTATHEHGDDAWTAPEQEKVSRWPPGASSFIAQRLMSL